MGQAAVEAMLVAGAQEQVAPSTENAVRLFAEAESREDHAWHAPAAVGTSE